MRFSISRREAFQRVGASAAVLGACALLGRWRWDKGQAFAAQGPADPQLRDFRVPSNDPALPELVISKSQTDPAALTEAALLALGGMSRFIQKGDTVVLKPNIGWDRSPIQAANTNPEVVGAVIKACYGAGAKKVIVTDVSCNEPQRCFQRSGIGAKATELGAEIVMPNEHQFETVHLRGEVLDEWPLLSPVLHANKVINLPIAKHHQLAKFTCAMKNWYGLLGGTRNRLHQNIDASIADLAQYLRPTLTVIDATRVLVRNGPTGGNIDDTRVLNTVLATTDQVAGDAYACALIGQKPENIGYLRLAHERGIGNMFWEKLRTREV